MSDAHIAANVACRFIESKESTWEDFERAVAAALKVHDKFQKWLSGFPRQLRKAIEESQAVGIPDGRVLMSPIHASITGPGGYENITWKTMRPLHDRIERVGWDLGLDDYLNPILGGLIIGGGPSNMEGASRGLDTAAIWNGEFTERHDIDGKDVTSLDVDRVEAWIQRLKKHTEFWQAATKKGLKAAKRSYKRKQKR